MNPRAGILATAALLAAVACQQDETIERTAAQRGEELFTTVEIGTSPLNVFACATCHPSAAAPPGPRRFPGADLAGVTERPSLWGGVEPDLARAIDHCRFYFMDQGRPWLPDGAEGRAMFAYLTSLPRTRVDAVPFTVPKVVENVPVGDAATGSVVYAEACRACHGDAHTGSGRLSARIPILPEEFLAKHNDGYSPLERRVTVVEKVRHGGFLGYGGNMPPFSREVLSDGDLGAVLAYLAF